MRAKHKVLKMKEKQLKADLALFNEKYVKSSDINIEKVRNIFFLSMIKNHKQLL